MNPGGRFHHLQGGGRVPATGHQRGTWQRPWRRSDSVAEQIPQLLHALPDLANIINSDRRNRLIQRMKALVLLVIAAVAVQAQTFTTLVNFAGPNGRQPDYGALVQGVDGDFYGTTALGGEYQYGTVFLVTPQGGLKRLHSFDNSDGGFPNNVLLEIVGGLLYGTTRVGGANGRGTIYSMWPGGGYFTTLQSFDVGDGVKPFAGLIQSFEGSLYGTSDGGGAWGYGTIFSMSFGGALNTVFSFNIVDGIGPYSTLMQASNKTIYGTTCGSGGSGNYGSIYTVDSSDAFATLLSFNYTDGAYPYGALVQASDGNLYGTTQAGGAYDHGTIFRMTTSGSLTTLHSFHYSDGSAPFGALVQGTDGSFYGTTTKGGAGGLGTIFQMTPAGVFATLHSFGGGDGATPSGGLVQGTDGAFYGMTAAGGANDDGTVFRLSTGLGPFVRLLPSFGPQDTSVDILGTDLTGVTSVSFNGVPASYITPISSTAFKVAVPYGATTGPVQVITPGSTLTSNALFQIP